MAAAEERAARSGYTTTAVTKDYIRRSLSPPAAPRGEAPEPILYSPGFKQTLHAIADRLSQEYGSGANSPGRQQRLRTLLDKTFVARDRRAAERSVTPPASPGGERQKFLKRAREVAARLDEFQRTEKDANEIFLQRMRLDVDRAFGLAH